MRRNRIEALRRLSSLQSNRGGLLCAARSWLECATRSRGGGRKEKGGSPGGVTPPRGWEGSSHHDRFARERPLNEPTSTPTTTSLASGGSRPNAYEDVSRWIKKAARMVRAPGQVAAFIGSAGGASRKARNPLHHFPCVGRAWEVDMMAGGSSSIWIRILACLGMTILFRRYIGRYAPEQCSNFGSFPCPRVGWKHSMSLIVQDYADEIGTIVLNNLSKRNALSHAMIDEVIATLGDLEARKARAVVLRAPPGCKVWSAGHDIAESCPTPAVTRSAGATRCG